MTVVRLRRDEQVERNRRQLLAAARQVFLERGFHAASLDAIAEAAGFSKGVVYSQFESKADLFLALLEERIEERASRNEELAARASGSAGLEELIELQAQAAAAEPAWALLLLEFRLHAARDPALNERYVRLHARTIERLATTLDRMLARTPGRTDGPPETMALFLLALGNGLALEDAASPGGLPSAEIRMLAARALGGDPRPAWPAASSERRRTAPPRRPGPGRGRRTS
ncbi:MAG: helix-turn-helix domain-containing protein [Thermodesulfobacteriota bacterium]